MDEDSSLPNLPGPPWSIAAPRGLSWMPRGTRARRMEANSLSTNSSDPAVFSSDDDQALDNYHVGRRRKKRYVGAWYNQQPALSSDASMDSGFGGEEDVKTLRPPKRRAPSLERSGPRKFKRQMDSGVWLSRDDMQSTDTEELGDMEMAPAPPTLLLRRPAMSEKEQLAQSLVQGCIDLGVESVDLTSCGLQDIPDTILDSISQIVPIPNVDRGVSFQQRDPEIRLFLSQNGIERFPLGIFNIQHLTVLSLRGNALKELPPCIASLQNLRSLNVAQNALQYLPAEILAMLKPHGPLETLKCKPNPKFFDVNRDSYHVYGPAEYEVGTFGMVKCELMASLVSRSLVQFSRRGTVVSDFKLPLQHVDTGSLSKILLEEEKFWHLATPNAAIAQHRQRRGPASLFEQALCVAATAPCQDEVRALLRAASVPRHFLPLFERAAEMERTGGQSCCICKRDMVVPATEWIEFRALRIDPLGPHPSISREECLVPFLQRGCSWDCIPFKVPPNPQMEETRQLIR